MSFITSITFDQILLSVLACIMIRQAMVFVLPDDIAGPGGRFINTDFAK